jgi:NADPH2:quinone reductase
MRAQQVESLIGPDGLRLVELDAPSNPDKVLIDVRAAGVSFPELLYTYGRYQVRPELPFVPGVEVAGDVLRAPEGSGYAVGDRVCACCLFGGWAEQAEAGLNLTFKLHPSLDYAEGAALVMNYQTAYHCLEVRGRTRRDEWVLVHGAAGGLGTAGVQVARGLGARTIAVVSSEEKARVALDAGADEAILFRDGWHLEARELTGGHGIDVVFDVVGGPRFVDSLRTLAPGGRLVVVGFADGEIPQVKVNRLLMTNTDVVGGAWGHWVECFPDSARRPGEELDRMIDAGVVRPPVGHRFALEDVGAALRTLEDRGAVGKVILEL